jgi:TIR domain
LIDSNVGVGRSVIQTFRGLRRASPRPAPIGQAGEAQSGTSKRPGSGAGVFISYRRDDSAGHAGRIYDSLVARMGTARVYMDVDSLHTPLGSDYREQVWQHIGSSGIVLAIIGRRWLSIADTKGEQRLQDPEDLVRQEITYALDRGIPVIPVLVENAVLPAATELPGHLTSLPDHQAIQLSDERWHYDIGRLMARIEDALGASRLADNPYLPPASRRRPTTWTRPLQLVNAGFFLAYSLSILALFPQISPAITPLENAIDPQVGMTIAPEVIQGMEVMAFIAIVVFAAVFLFLAFASYRGWRWMFWVGLAVLGMNAFGVSSGNGPLLPIPIIGYALSLAALVLFAWMMIGLIRFGPGPWSTRRTL